MTHLLFRPDNTEEGKKTKLTLDEKFMPEFFEGVDIIQHQIYEIEYIKSNIIN